MSVSTVVPTSAARSEAAARSGFFFWVSVLLLSCLLIGFAPTLYLRALVEAEPIPAYLHVHGMVLTSWYVWLVVQTSMVRTGRTATHRRLGVIGAFIGAAVVVAGPMATLGVVGRVRRSRSSDPRSRASRAGPCSAARMGRSSRSCSWGYCWP